MLFVKFDTTLARTAMDNAARGSLIGVDEYNALVAMAGGIRDMLRTGSNVPPRVSYDGPIEALRAANTEVPVVGYSSPTALDDSQPAGSSAAEQQRYLRAQYSAALSDMIERLRAGHSIVRMEGPSSGLGLDYSGQVAVVGDLQDALVDPALTSSMTRVRVDSVVARDFQSIFAGLEAVAETSRAASENRSVSPSALSTAQAGLARAETFARKDREARSQANLRAIVVFAGLIGASYLWGR